MIANSKMTIMVVDDTPANLALLETMLQNHGVRVVAFPRGEMALRAAAESPPDLVLLDIMMPEMDGFEVCRRLRQLTADNGMEEIPVIFISALDDASSIVKAFAHGGADYVCKPFQEEEVLARVNVQMRVLSLQRQLRLQNERLEELVAERTRELARANARLIDLGRIKNDFLGMISHEIRTPANGILAVGEMLMSRDCDQELLDIFTESSQRLRDLIADATMIGEMDDLAGKALAAHPLSMVLDDLRDNSPQVEVSVDPGFNPQSTLVWTNLLLLQRALGTMVSIASVFAQKTPVLRVYGQEREAVLQIDLDALGIPDEAVEQFFELESNVRGATPAEALGLAPVVAGKILSACGGKLYLWKKQNDEGFLKATVPVMVPD